jgi:hypothetical protein
MRSLLHGRKREGTAMTSWEIKEAIRETINGYSGAAGRLDIEGLLTFFVPDGEVVGVTELLGLDASMQGHEGIRSIFGPAFAAMDWLSQMNTITSIEVAEDCRSARTVTNLVEMAQRKDAPQIVLIARYEDDLALTDGGWKFARRRLVPLRFAKVP